MLARVKTLPAGLVSPDMRKRLGAWWRGEHAEKGVQETRRAKADDKGGPAEWLVVAEQLWGDGALGPAEDKFVAELGERLSLNAETTLGYLGIGLGAAARSLADQTDVTITGYEPNADVADRGTEQGKAAPGGKNVDIRHMAFDRFELPKDAFDVVAGKESLHDVADRERVFKQIAHALKSGGTLLLTDYVVTSDPLDAGTCLTLFGKRSLPVSPCTAQAYRELSKSQGLESSADEDLTDLYIACVSEGWSNLRALLDQLGAQADDPARRTRFLRTIADEAAMWANRLEALRTRKLEVRRFLARKPA